MEVTRSEGLKMFEGKRIKIQTNSNLFYHTSNLQVFGDMVVFTDKLGLKVTIPVAEIKKIEELR
jgi:uncharacterized Fe-S cluster protein YjdI